MTIEYQNATGDELCQTILAAGGGDRTAWGTLWTIHEDRLLRMVRLRLDLRLRGRVDPADVLNEAWIEARHRLAGYVVGDRKMPFGLWLRFLVRQQILIHHRRHFAAKCDPGREQPFPGGGPKVSSEALVWELTGSGTRPSEAAVRNEWQKRVRDALEKLAPVDREVLAMRHFEQLSNAECAEILGLSHAGATRRYLRAVQRMKGVMIPGPFFPEES